MGQPASLEALHEADALGPPHDVAASAAGPAASCDIAARATYVPSTHSGRT
jgi:hypothetical protein